MPLVIPKAPTAVPVSEDHALTVQLINAFKEAFQKQMKASGKNPVKFSQLGVIAFARLAAIYGVDVGMKPEQFINVCRACFVDAHNQAPKFGE